MKRPAVEQLEIERPRTRRRISSHRKLKNSNIPAQPRDGLVADDETGQIKEQDSQENHKHSEDEVFSGLLDVASTFSEEKETQPVIKSDISSHAMNGKGEMTPHDRTSRPLRRLKLLPLKEPATPINQGETESPLDSPTMSPIGLRAPPGSPSRDGDSDSDEKVAGPFLVKNDSDSEGKEYILDLSKLPPSPTPLAELNEPEHRLPTPPFYAQHFNPTDVSPYEGGNDSLSSSARNANTYLRKAKFQKPRKRQRTKGVWSFTNCDEYPRGETPPLELMLRREDGDSVMGDSALGLSLGPKQQREESEEEDDNSEEILRDPGIAISLAVGIDSNSRFVCKWGECNKTFARNDHLGRHVKVAHLRVRKHRCEPCGIAFIGVKGLRNHQHTHKSEAAPNESSVVGADTDAAVNTRANATPEVAKETSSPVTIHSPTASSTGKNTSSAHLDLPLEVEEDS